MAMTESTATQRLVRTIGAGLASLTVIAAVSAAMAYAQSPAPRELPLKHAPQPTTADISAADLMTRLYIVADDSMEGRAFGQRGNVKATDYIAGELRELRLEPAGDSGTYFQTLPSHTTAGQYPGRNVVAILRGTDPRLRSTYVAIGAHTDHIGIVPPDAPRRDHDSTRTWRVHAVRIARTVADPAKRDRLIKAFVVNVDSLRKLRPARIDTISNGADDDGSGTVAVLEIAEALAQLPAKPKRSILFVFHTGEEAGLLGSKYFMDHPTVPCDSIIAQINLDMIGRGGADDALEPDEKMGPNMLKVVGANRLSSELGQLIEKVNIDGHHGLDFDYRYDAPNDPEDIYSRSDHYSYAGRGIPIAFFFTGLHLDYHVVTDEPQYIDYPHLETITKYVYDLMLALGNQLTRLTIDHPVKP